MLISYKVILCLLRKQIKWKSPNYITHSLKDGLNARTPKYFIFNMYNKVSDGLDYSNENLKYSMLVAEKVRDGQIIASSPLQQNHNTLRCVSRKFPKRNPPPQICSVEIRRTVHGRV